MSNNGTTDNPEDDVVAELEKLQAEGIEMPNLPPEEMEAAQKRLDKKLVGITSMREAISIMVEDIKENQPETKDPNATTFTDKELADAAKGTLTGKPALVLAGEEAPGENLEKSAAEGGAHVEDLPGFKTKQEVIDNATEGALKEKLQIGEFEARLKAAVEAPYTEKELKEIRDTQGDGPKARRVQIIKNRRTKAFLTTLVLDGAVGKLVADLNRACPHPSMGEQDAKDLVEGFQGTVGAGKMDKVMAELKEMVGGLAEDNVPYHKLPGISVAEKAKSDEVLRKIKAHKPVEGVMYIPEELDKMGDQSGLHQNEIDSQVKPDDRS